MSWLLLLQPVGRRARHQSNLVDRNSAGGQTGDHLMQAAAGPKPHCGMICKLAFMKGSGFVATDQNNERDTGAELELWT